MQDYNRIFGTAYRNLVNDVIKNMHVSRNNVSEEFDIIETATNEELKKINQNGMIQEKDILNQSEITEYLDLKKVRRCYEYAVLVYFVDTKEYSDIIGNSRAASYTGEIPFILLRNKYLIINNSIFHEAGHIVYDLLTRQNIVSLDKNLPVEDKADFCMFKDELISKLLEKAKPYGYTLNVLLSTPEKESKYIKKNRIFINDIFPEILEDAKKKLNYTHKDFIYPVFISSNFNELHRNITRSD